VYQLTSWQHCFTVLPLCCYGIVLDFMIKKTLDSQKDTRLQKQTYTP